MTDVGYVYILTNDSFREDWVKIGKSSRPVNVRSKELDNTAVPLPFNIYATIETKKYSQVEKLVHKTIDRLTDLRIRQNREFFNVAPEIALDIFRDIATTIDDAKVVLYKNNKPIVEPVTPPITPPPPNPSRRSRFKFYMIGLRPGDEVVFIPTNQAVRIASDTQIEAPNGRLYTLSAYAHDFMPEKLQNTSGSYQGPLYFSYKGKNLVELRREAEENLDQG